MIKELEARTILWIMVFTGFGVNYMVRTNINIVLVDMVNPTRSSNTGNTTLQSACGNTILTVQSTEETESLEEATSRKEERFDWNEREQNVVLGAYFWLHWLTQIPGGLLARTFGTKMLFGIGNGIPVLLTFLAPLAASFDYRMLAALRLLQGIISGVVWPSMHNMTALWVPPNERSRFVTAYLGGSVGAGLTFVFCAQVVHWFGWPAAFYSTALIGSIWLLAWIFLVYDTPAKHPRISAKERTSIEGKLEGTVTTDKMATPWLSIATSVPVWMIVVAQWAGIWAILTIQTQIPTYFRNVHGWDVRAIGLISGLPLIARLVVAAGFSTYCDYLLRKELMSRTNVRKLATGVGIFGQGVVVVVVAMSGCNVWTATVCIIMASAIQGATSGGPLPAMIDLSPNFAGTVLGMSGVITVLPGFISPIVVGYITYQNQTVLAWGKVFGIMAAQLLLCGILYVAFGSTELQPWNSPKKVCQVPEYQTGLATAATTLGHFWGRSRSIISSWFMYAADSYLLNVKKSSKSTERFPDLLTGPVRHCRYRRIN